jgi:PEP-CTERM motif
MKNSARKSILSRLADKKRRMAYSLAAGAAAYSAASSGQDADAAVVYSGLVNANVGLTTGPFYPLTLDLDNDLLSDVAMKNFLYYGGPYQGLSVYGTGKVMGFNAGPYNFAYVSSIAPGTVIDSSTVGPTFFGSMAYGASNPNAEFNNSADAYLGLSFGTAPNLRYGWIRVGIDNANASFVVKDWAYESTFNQGIVAAAPEPGTLGLLAAGAAGVLALRRRRSAAA